MKRRAPFWMTVAFSALAWSCGGTSELGGSCDTSGATDECVSGGICTNESGGAAACRKICTEQTDCAANENCNGINDSTQKSCQPK